MRESFCKSCDDRSEDLNDFSGSLSAVRTLIDSVFPDYPSANHGNFLRNLPLQMMEKLRASSFKLSTQRPIPGIVLVVVTLVSFKT